MLSYSAAEAILMIKYIDIILKYRDIRKYIHDIASKAGFACIGCLS